MLSILTALNELPKTTITQSKPSSLQIESGNTFLPVKGDTADEGNRDPTVSKRAIVTAKS